MGAANRLRFGCLGGVKTPRRDQLTRNELMKSSLPPVGQVFGRLTVLGLGRREKYWLCQCRCGSEPKEIYCYSLAGGATQSCGCILRENPPRKEHGMSKTKIHRIWCGMHERCSNPNHVFYGRYGGRGIYVCDEWRKFENFYKDMGEKPPGMSLDRIDNDGPYAPWNCRWATTKEQIRNSTLVTLLTWKGKTQSIVEWSEELGINKETVSTRLGRGWSVERALSESVRKVDTSWRNKQKKEA